MLDNKRAALFDLDGTLVDSMWIWGAIDIDFLAAYGLDVPPGLQQTIEGMSFSEVAQYFKERFALSQSTDEIKHEWITMAEEKYRLEVPLKAGVIEVLPFLKSKNMKLAVASSNSMQLVEKVLEAHAITEYFDCILTSCEVPRGKPAPDVYLEAARRLQVAPEHCIVYEDIPSGLMAGNAARMQTCAVYDRHSQPQEAQIRRLASYYIHSFNEVISGQYEILGTDSI